MEFWFKFVVLRDNGEGEVLGGIECGCKGCAYGVQSLSKGEKGFLGKAFGDDDEVKSKIDDSLVTIAGSFLIFFLQFCFIMGNCMGGLRLVDSL